MPSSSLVEVAVDLGVAVGVEVQVQVEVEVKVRAQNYFFAVGGWVGGWKWRITQSSNLKLKLELGNSILFGVSQWNSKYIIQRF